MTTLLPLPAPARRARRHPWAILALYAWQSALALLAAVPAASLARAAYGNDPRGDAALWAPGGRALLDFLWHEQHALAVAGSLAEVVLFAALVAGLVPTAAALVSLCFANRDGRRAGFVRSFAEGLKSFPALLLLLVAAGVLLAILALCGFAADEVVESWCHGAWGDATAQTVGAAAVLPVLVAASVVLVVQDMARAAVVRFTAGAWRGLAVGIGAFLRAPLALWWAWAWRGLASLLPVAAVAFVVDGGTRGWPGLLLWLALAHQAVVFVRVVLRVSWWARALRSVDAGSPLPQP